MHTLVEPAAPDERMILADAPSLVCPRTNLVFTRGGSIIAGIWVWALSHGLLRAIEPSASYPHVWNWLVSTAPSAPWLMRGMNELAVVRPALQFVCKRLLAAPQVLIGESAVTPVHRPGSQTHTSAYLVFAVNAARSEHEAARARRTLNDLLGRIGTSLGDLPGS